MESPRTLDELKQFDPDWCLFWSERVRVTQLAIWLPYIRRSRFRYAIVASEDAFPDSVRETIAGLTNCVILEPFAEAKRWLRACRSFRGFLIISTKPEVFSIVNSFRGHLHVWLGHGESDKAASYSRSASLYDSVFVARYDSIRHYPRAIRRWVASGACAIGAPIVEGTAKDPWQRPRPVRTVLYAPTWEGYRDNVDYSSVPECVPALIDALPRLAARGTRLVVRPHPGNGSRLPERREMIDALIAAGAIRGSNKVGDFADADVLLGDISGVTSEFLFTEKPTIMPYFERLSTIGRSASHLRGAYPWVQLWKPGEADLLELLGRLETADPLRSRRAAAARRMFRGHRSLEDAARSFDLALSTVRWRKVGYVSVRRVFEFRRAIARIRRGVPAPAKADREPA